jgi:hypothetical protein
MLSSVLSLQWSGFCFRRVRRKDLHRRLFAVQSEASAGYGGVEMVPLSERDCRTKFLANGDSTQWQSEPRDAGSAGGPARLMGKGVKDSGYCAIGSENAQDYDAEDG